jgi:hydroxymethylpyrimidine/phosphomethylpyrimidine kinase
MFGIFTFSFKLLFSFSELKSKLKRKILACLFFQSNWNNIGIKIGALGSVENIGIVAELLLEMLNSKRKNIHVVLDPVFGASAGGLPLLPDEAIKLNEFFLVYT